MDSEILYLVRIEVVGWIARNCRGMFSGQLKHFPSRHFPWSAALDLGRHFGIAILDLSEYDEGQPLVVAIAVPGVTTEIEHLQVFPVGRVGKELLFFGWGGERNKGSYFIWTIVVWRKIEKFIGFFYLCQSN